MATTLQQLRDISYAIIRTDEDTTAYPLVLLDSFLNLAQKKIFKGRVVNPLNQTNVVKWQLPFTNKEVIYSNVAVTYISSDVTTGDTSIEADTTNYPSDWYIYIEGTIVQYASITATSFEWCTGVIADFQWGTQISIAYAVPSDFSSSINLTFNNVYKVPCKVFDDIFEDMNSYKWVDTLYYSNVSTQSTTPFADPFYTIKDDAYLILFNLNNTGQRIRFRYQKNPTTMVDNTDTASIPDDDYVKNTIPYLAVAEMFYNRGEESRAAEIINFAMGNIREMYDHYNKSSFESISGTRYKTGKSKLNV